MPAGKPIKSAALPPIVIVLWLTSAAIVGVVGCIVLDRAQVGHPLTLGRAVMMVLVVEVLLYLLALIVGGRGAIPAGRVVVGMGLGLIIRASLSLIAAQLAPSVRAEATTLGPAFGFYYARYWLGALVQVLAVSVFLWFIRDLWKANEARWTAGTRGEQFLAEDEPEEDRQARREELLAALMEGPEEEEVEPLPQAVKSEQLSLPVAEVEAEATESADVDEDTSRIPAVVEEEEAESVRVGEAQAQPEEERQQLSPAEKLLIDAAGEGAVVDTVTLTGGGGLVWAAPMALEQAALDAPAGRLIDGAELVGEVAQMGPVELVTAEGEAGCWVFSPIREAPRGWWLGLAQAAPVTVGMMALALRKVRADWPVVHLAESRPIAALPEGIAARQTEYTDSAAVAELARQWGAQAVWVTVADQTVIVIGPPGVSVEAVAGVGLQMWHATTDLRSLLDWDEPTSVLVGFAEGAVALGKPGVGREQPVLIVMNRDSSQVAAAALRLNKLSRQFQSESGSDGIQNGGSYV